MPRMVATGGRPYSGPDARLALLKARARRRRRLLDLSRRVTARLELRWALAARDLRDALDLRRVGDQ